MAADVGTQGLDKTVEEATALLDTLLGAAPVGFGMVDTELRYVRVNPTLAAINGVPAEAHLGRRPTEVLRPVELAAQAEAMLRHVLDSGEPALDLALSGETPDRPGVERHWTGGFYPVRSKDGRLLGVAVMVTEVTEHVRMAQALRESNNTLRVTRAELERRAAELERSNAELEQFAYAASHDLREPLRAIAGYGKLLERRLGDTLDEQSRELLDYALDGAARLQTLIDDLLAYARASYRPLQRGPVALDGLVEQCLRRLAPAIDDSGAELHVGELPTVDGDETQLCQLIQNLVSNALKFCERTPDVTVTAAREAGAWRIDVADNGVGIPPGQADRVFEMFSRLHSHRYPGTGIGLALCRRILERHGGRIWHEPVPSGGTVFHFTLPDQAGP
ncbi:MAG TPA: ATP-binding protein [Actinomycetes bacterium]